MSETFKATLKTLTRTLNGPWPEVGDRIVNDDREQVGRVIHVDVDGTFTVECWCGKDHGR